VLFQIDPRPYEAAYNQAKANLSRDSATAAYAAIEAMRYDSLVRKDYVTKEQAGQEEMTSAAAAATVQSDAALLANAKFNLDNSTVRAPIAGRTGNLLVREGNLVHGAAATPLVVINQIHPILVQFAVPATNLPDIQKYSATGALLVTVYQVAVQSATSTPPAGAQPSAAADPGGDAPPGTAVSPATTSQQPKGGRRHATAAGAGTAATGPPSLASGQGASGQGASGQSANTQGASAAGAATDSSSPGAMDDASGGGPPGGGVYGASTDVVPTGAGVTGALSFVNNAIDTTTGTVLLKATFANAKDELWPGEYVATILRLFVQQNALVVPPQAVMTGQQGTYVFVVDTKTNTAQQRPVVIQRSTDTLDVISSGLSEGEHVVTDGQSRLQNGAKVNVRALTNAGGAAPSSAATPVTAGHPRTTN
jgi:multidrug efflux system membrane fusion protein